MLLAVVFFVNGPLWTVARRDAMTLTSRNYVTLEADGTGSSVTELTYRHYGPMPLHQLDFYSGVPTSMRWIDRSGGELESETVKEGENYRHTAWLPEPVMPGDDLNYLRISPTSSTIRDDVWTLGMDWFEAERGANERFTYTVRYKLSGKI